MKNVIENLIFQLDVSLSAVTPQTFAHDQLTTLKNLLTNETLPALNRIDATRYSPQGYQAKQAEVLHKTAPVLERISKSLSAKATAINGQLASMVLQSPLDSGDKAERLSHEREIRDVYRTVEAVTLEERLWSQDNTAITVAVLRSPLPMLNDDAKQRLETHLRQQQYPGASALEAELHGLQGVRGFVASMQRELLGE